MPGAAAIRKRLGRLPCLPRRWDQAPFTEAPSCTSRPERPCTRLRSLARNVALPERIASALRKHHRAQAVRTHGFGHIGVVCANAHVDATAVEDLPFGVSVVRVEIRRVDSSLGGATAVGVRNHDAARARGEGAQGGLWPSRTAPPARWAASCGAPWQVSPACPFGVRLCPGSRSAALPPGLARR